jgi:hypothetical protein
MRLDKVTQHTDVLNSFNLNSRSGRDRKKEKALTRGDLIVHGLAKVRGQQRP